MNVAVRGIEGQISHGNSFHRDRHPHLEAGESGGGNLESRSSASMTLVHCHDVTLARTSLCLLKLCPALQ